MSAFSDGFADSFPHELEIMGEEIEANGVRGMAVVDALEVGMKLNGALITEDGEYDIYILASEAERLGIEDHVKVTLNEQGGVSGRVKWKLPIDGGQIRFRIGPNTPRP